MFLIKISIKVKLFCIVSVNQTFS